jgi:drug/metabolite transporter (DMT)-like permease
MSGADSPIVTLAFTGIVGFLVLSAIVPFTWVGLGWPEVLLGIVSGGAATSAQWFTVLAYRHASASLLSPFFYSQLVWATALGFVLFGHVPDLWTFTGAGVIIASGLYTAQRERARAQGRG